MSNSLKAKWVIDPTHSEISFKVKHLMITNVKGVFNEFSGSILTSGDSYHTSEIEFSLNTASVDTGAADRDRHLRSPDFFDVEKHPTLTFKGSSFQNKGAHGNYFLQGDLTIKGISKPVKLNVEFNGTMKDPWGNHKAGYTVTGKINRKDWGLNWNALLEAGGVLVSDDVAINCDVQLLKQV